MIAPHGGKVGSLDVQRTFATARSVEFDVLLLAAAEIAEDAFGVVTGSAGPDVFGEVRDLMGTHRAWERFPAKV